MGTLITKAPAANETKPVKAVAMIKDVRYAKRHSAGMVGAPGGYAKVFDVAEIT